MNEPTNPCNACDGATIKALALAGKNWLGRHYERVNQLNVFPVPDGDTGTNMLLTMTNACKEVANFDSPSAAQMTKRIAHGAVMGSRGNSGVITSQIWAGFAAGLGDADSFDVPTAIAAFQLARDRAYQGVQSPVEGTILTIIREMAEEAEQLAESTNLIELLERVVARGWEAVSRTPQMLPVLQEAGVVDSGGTGLCYILEGMLKYLQGEVIEIAEIINAEAHDSELPERDLSALANEQYNYDVQFVIRGQNLDVLRIRREIEAMGDSGVIVGDETLVKVHIHVDNPAVPIDYGVRLGTLLDVVIENMQAQYEDLLAQDQGQKLKLKAVAPDEIAVVAVAAGAGQARVLADLGVAAIIEGGQTNNPSIGEILEAVRATHAGRVIVLPNNKNIILAAEQAINQSEGEQITVVPTRTFPQGVAAMLSYQAAGDLTEITAAMTESSREVVTGEVTVAVRSVEIDGVAVQEGQVIGLIDGKLRLAGSDIFEVIEGILETLDLDDYELVTLYFGADISPADAATLASDLGGRFGIEIETVYGGQPHYPYLLSIE